jgi:hypothetical protein
LVVSEQDAFRLIAYLLTAAELHVDEPPIYGTLRLVTATSQLIDAMLKHVPQEESDLYREWNGELIEKRDLIMSDRDEYVRFLSGMSRRVAEELKRRTY